VPLKKNQGRGVASGYWFNGGGESSATVQVNDDGTVLVATGSPFPEVVLGRRRRRSIAQANNAFVFPAIGLACVVGQVREVTDGMFRAVAEALAKEVTADDLRRGRLLPRVQELRAVTARLAAAVLRQVRESGGTVPFPGPETEAAVVAAMWEPRYLDLVPADYRTTGRPVRGAAGARPGPRDR
jgi:malate dehydrogenase (oxaloacetate-decarboxylating)